MNIAVFASGAGTNAETIIRHFNRDGSPHRVTLVVVDRGSAGAAARAMALDVGVAFMPPRQLADVDATLPMLMAHGVDFIALAGFLSMVPGWMIDLYPGRIVNIHPSLLPRHGGKGMWGRHVHEAVLAAGDTESGITIHHVDREYDTGSVIFSTRVPVLPGDTPDTLASRIHELEHEHYPRVIEQLLGGGSIDSH